MVDKLISSWQWNGNVTVQSGFPFTPLVGSNASGSGDTQNPDVPNWNPDFKGPVILGRPDQWFNPAAFAVPALGTYGNVGQSSIVGPHYWDWSEAVSRQFRVREKQSIEVRAEAFNVTNSLRPGNPGIFRGQPNTFGKILCSASGASATGCSAANATPSTSGGPRIVQFALKYVF